MEVLEHEILGSNKMAQKLIVKRKRTKRPRPPPMFPDLPLSRNTYSSSSSSCSTAAESSGDDRVLTSLTSEQTCEFPQTEVVNDEDLANCLILLAQGHNRLQKSSYPPIITGVPDNSGIGGDVYKCKTCGRRFPSFQALGGHRTSHKKPKGIIEEKICSGNLQIHDLGRVPVPSCRDSGSSVNKFKVHECSVCGAEFNSGQALGGHMRRHRPINPVRQATGGEDSQVVKKSRTNDLLELDLNLPAPEVDELASDYTFESKEEGLVFSPSSLVDCHYYALG